MKMRSASMSLWLTAAAGVALTAGFATAQHKDLAGPGPEMKHLDRHANPFFSGLAPYDIRRDEPGIVALIAQDLAAPEQLVRLQAGRAFTAAIPGAAISFDERLGTPKFIRSTRQMLTPAVAGPVNPEQIMLGFVRANRELMRIDENSLATARTTRRGVSANGVTTIWRQQRVGDVDVVGAELRANVDRAGRLVTVSSTMIESPAEKIGAARALLSRTDAVGFAAKAIGVELKEPLRAMTPAPDAEHRQVFEPTAGLQLPVSTRFVYFPVAPSRLRPAFEITIGAARSADVYRVYIDAVDGAVLSRHNHTVYGGVESATYSFYAGDSPEPVSPGPATPDGTQGAVVARTIDTLVSMDAVASPDGWIPDGQNELTGNNVDAFADVNGDDLPDLPRTQGSPFRTFDFPLDLAQDPSTYTDAAIANIFYWSNWFHDRMYGLGFTEEFANFQTNNFGRGGLGGDAVTAHAQDGIGFENANFLTFTDGSLGRMQMFLWPDPTPTRDGDLDIQVVIHELAHGLSTRLHGVLNTLQGAGMGEGWSDFYALSLLSEPGDDPAGIYALGAYATFLGEPGYVDNAYFGIRRYPYTTDQTRSPLTFADIDAGQFAADPLIPRNPAFGPTTPVTVHNIGEVWCSMLWQVRANLIAKHGFAVGNEIALQLVTDGMKLSHANPTYVESRDAIIVAELVSGGDDLCEVWSGFASRGLGASAFAPPPEDTVGVIEAFDLPDTLFIRYPDGLPPTVAAPAALETFPVQISGPCAGSLLAGSEVLLVSIDGAAFQAFGLTLDSPGQYTATFPSFLCGEDVQFYIQAQTDTATFVDPPLAPAETFSLFVSNIEDIRFDDDFEGLDTGWIIGSPTDDATTGVWMLVDPVGTEAQPAFDNTPGAGSLCYITGQGIIGGTIGADDVDGGTTTLTSPAFDATGGDAFLSYYRWYSNDQGATPNTDTMPIEVSNDDGMSWTLLEDVTENANAWVFKNWNLNDIFAMPSSQVRVRFLARDLPEGSIIEAGVDDVRVTVLVCDFNPSQFDLNGDGFVGSADLAMLLGSWGPCPMPPALCPADFNGDGFVGAADLAALLGSWG